MYPIPDEKKNQQCISEIGPGTKGLVIHRRYVSEDNLKVVVECTLLKRDGVPCPVNTSDLIEMIAVEQYIIHSKSNIIINQLEQVENKNMMSLSQLSECSIPESREKIDFSQDTTTIRIVFDDLPDGNV